MEFNKFAGHTASAKMLGHSQRKIGRKDAFVQAPDRRTPITSGIRRVTGMPNITPSASSPPTPQARTPMPLIIGVWLSVPTRCREMPGYAVPLLGGHHRRQALKIDRVHDARARRVHAHAFQRARRPFRKRYRSTLRQTPVPCCERERCGCHTDRQRRNGRPKRRRRGGFNSEWIFTGLEKSIPHSRNIDERRDAGRVVHQQTTRPELDFFRTGPASSYFPECDGRISRRSIAAAR